MPPQAPPSAPGATSVVAPTTVFTLDQLIDQEARTAGVNPALLRRIIQQESAGNPAAVSKKGARGLGQLMPETAKALGVNPDNPIENVRGAARYLRQQLDAFGGDETKALAAYNAGPGAVQKYGGVPPFPETQEYVRRIQGGGRGARPTGAPTGPPRRTPVPTRAAAPPAAPTGPVVQESIVSPTEISLTPPALTPETLPTGALPPPGGPTQVAPAAPPAAGTPAPAPAAPQGVAGAPQAPPGPPPAPPPSIGRWTSPSDALRRLQAVLDPGVERVLAGAAATGLGAVESGLQWAGGKVASGVETAVDAFRTNPAEATRATAQAVLPVAGGMIGGALVARKGPAGWAKGAGAGTAAGEVASMGVEALTGAPPTLEQAIRRTIEAGVTGAASEGAARGAMKVAGKVMRPMADRITQYGREALEKYGPRFTPDQVTEHRGLDIAANLASGVGGGKYKRFTEATEQFFESEERQRLLEPFGGKVTPETAGKIWQAAREAGSKTFHKRAAAKYADVAAKAGDAQIPMSGLREFAEEELAKRTAIPGEVSGDSGLRLLKQLVKQPEAAEESAELIGGRSLTELKADPSAQNLLTALRKAGAIPEEADALPDTLTFEQAQFFASELKKLVREKSGGPTKDKRLVGVAQQLLKRLEQATDEALPADAQQALRQTNAWYKSETARLDSDALRKIARKDPELVVNAIVQGGKTTIVRAARQAVPDAHWRKIQANVVRRLLQDKHGNLDLGEKMVEKLTKLTPETLNEVFPKGEAAEVIQVARILDQIQRNREGTGKMFIQLSQAGAMSNVLTGGKVGQVARATLVLPWTMSTLLTSKLGRQWLTTGFQSPRGSAEFTRALTQASAWLARQAMQEAQGGAYREAWRGEQDREKPENPFDAPTVGGPPPANPFEGGR